MDAKLFRFDTIALHAGQRADPATGARAVPIYQTTSYVFEGADQAASLFNLERAGHIYSRISNPTVAVLEERVAQAEGEVQVLVRPAVLPGVEEDVDDARRAAAPAVVVPEAGEPALRDAGGHHAVQGAASPLVCRPVRDLVHSGQGEGGEEQG